MTNIARLSALAVAGLSLSSALFAQTEEPFRLTGGAPGQARYVTVPNNFLTFSGDMSSPEAATAAALPSWTGSSNGVTYTMLGADPSSGVATTLPVVFIPLIFKIGSATFDPTLPVAGSTKSAVTLMRQSPIFQPVDLTAGPFDLGANQWIDNFSRANFWTQTGSGTNGYHLRLSAPVVKAANTLTVPPGQGITINTGGGLIGDVNIAYFQAALNKILAVKQGINPGQLVIFVYYNVFFYQGNSSNCCILGFHGEVTTPLHNNHLIYSASAFNNSGIFNVPPGQFLEDVTVITHEIGEAVDDPYISSNVNVVPAFGHIGQVSGCQGNLEVGDPVTGMAKAVAMPNGFTYHPEDLVFHGWFSRETHSTSVNGWYTLLNTFHGNAKPCPPGGTN